MITPVPPPPRPPRPVQIDAATGRAITCPKCRAVATGVMYQRPIPASPAGPAIPEHLRRWCNGCRYDWATYDFGGAS